MSDSNGSINRPLRILAYPGEEPIIDNQYSNKLDVVLHLRNVDYVEIGGLHFQNLRSDIKESVAVAILASGSARKLDIHDNEVLGIKGHHAFGFLVCDECGRRLLSKLSGVELVPVNDNFINNIRLHGNQIKNLQTTLLSDSENKTELAGSGRGIAVFGAGTGILIEDNVVEETEGFQASAYAVSGSSAKPLQDVVFSSCVI